MGHRLLSNQRGTEGVTPTPQRPASRRSGALRAWQASLENQSQALLERSLTLLNHSAPDGASPDQASQVDRTTAGPYALLDDHDDDSEEMLNSTAAQHLLIGS